MKRYKTIFELKEAKKMILYHATNGNKLILSTKKERLVPHSLSCSNKPKYEYGKNLFKITIKDNAKILVIDVNNNFYDFGKEYDTPVNRGKAIYDYAIKHKYDIVKLINVPHVRIEYCILNLNVIEKYEKI